MKQRFFTLMLTAIFAIGALSAQDLDKILKAHFKTIGQEKVLEAKTMKVSGKMLMQGMELQMKMITKRPSNAYMEMNIQGVPIKQGYDGKNGWMINPMTGSAEPIDITGPELRSLKEMGDMDGKLWNYKEKGHTVELIGKEDLEGSEVFVIKLTDAEGHIDHYYMDAENYVILKSKSKTIINGSEVEVESYLSNYQEIDGLVMPFSIEQRAGGQTMMTFNIEDVKYNEPVDDKIFAKPVVSDKPADE